MQKIRQIQMLYPLPYSYRFSSIRITSIQQLQVLALCARMIVLFFIQLSLNNDFTKNKMLMEQINWRRAETNLGVSSCSILVVSVLFRLLNCLKFIYSHVWKRMN